MSQVNVNLAFNADTGKAKTQIMELQSLLSKIAYTGATGGTDKLQADLHAASEAAKELQFHLNNAFNASTGNFDLSMLDRSLKTSGSNITDLSVKLLSAGATGQQAFVKLAQSISLADQPMFRISKRMQDFAVTMKNTVKWQLSSSMLHGFMGAVQSAYGYAQDLNESLNNIRIVTGYNIDKMAQFAEQANKAAKALSTTTTDYTDASLIYFQQGLSDAEVQGRTDTTIKLANVTGQSVEETANQMTAIWNNFDDGSKSLDYYADVITALGAATASSSKEISEGLNKFSAIAESVGLSYEYASAALATVTATTRQSADIVGNSFKTLFARIQGLNLGETLDDGTTLNKYSEALFKVGINVKDQSGQLKDMNTILDEMGSKWNTLGKDQQVALAQTVGGVRQYTQLIALMDNWDYFQQNLGVATGAEGTLNKQAEIYAQSWEAAEKRVQAAAEGIYQSLLDDKFFISLNNGFANALNGIDAFIDGAGGVKTVLTGIAGIIISTFANKIPQALDIFKYNLTFLIKGTKDAYQDIQDKMTKATKMAFTGFENKTTGEKVQPIKEDSALGYQITAANELTAARSKLALVSDRMSASEKQMANTQLSIIEVAQEELVVLKQKNEALAESIKLQQESIQKSSIDNTTKAQSEKAEIDILALDKNVQRRYQEATDVFNEALNATEIPDDLGVFSDQQQQLEFLSTEMMGFSASYEEAVAEINSAYGSLGQNIFDKFIAPGDLSVKEEILEMPEWFTAAFNEIKSTVDFEGFLNDEFNFTTVQQQMVALSNTIPKAVQEATGLDRIFKNLGKARTGAEFVQEFKNLETKLQNCKIEGKDFQKVLESLYGKGKIGQLTNDMDKLAQNEVKATEKAGILKNLLNEFNPQHVVRISEAMGSLAGLMGNVVTIGNSLKSMLQSLGNPDLSGWEKFSAVLTGLSVLIPTILSSLQAAATINEFLSKSYGKSAIAIGIDTAAKTISTKVTTALGIANTGLVASMGPLLVIIAAVAAAIWIAVKAFKFLKWIFDSIKNASPEGKLEATKEATEAMAVAAQDATTAYQNLLNTISGYDSAVAALENLEVGTQEFTNALITANEKAWELIDAYGLIQSQDWYYGKNGEIIINDEAKNRISEEANERREDAIVAASATEIAEAQAAYNLSQSKAGMVGYDIQQGNLNDKVLYDALGLTNGSFEHLKGQVKFDEYGNLESVGTEIGDAVAQALYGKDYGVLDTSQLEYINNNIFSYLDEIEAMYGDYDNLNNINQNQRQKMVSTSLSDEEAYQQTAWKGLIADELDKQYDVEKAHQDELFAAKTDEQVASVFAKYLTDQGYIQGEDGKVYKKNEDGTPGDEVTRLSNLSADAQRNILATVEAMRSLEDQGVQMAEGFNQVATTMSDEETAMADALINNNLGALTEEQIQQLKAAGDIKPEDLFDPQTLAAIRNNPILNTALKGWLADLEKSVAEWEPPLFNLESWKADYVKKMDIINSLETGDEISAEDYALLEEEYSQYFQVQADGTAILIAKAEELKAAAQDIEIGELEDDIRTKQDTINRMNEANIVTESGRELDFNAAHNAAMQGTLHESWNEAYINAVNEALGTTYTTVQEANTAYNEYVDSLNDSQQTLASTADSVNDLDKRLADGLITQEQYNEAIDGTVMKEALEEGFDPESIIDFGEALEEVIDDFEGADKVAKKLALENKKLNQGIQILADNWDDWKEALKDSTSPKYYEALTDIQNTMEDIFGIKPDASFIQDNLEMIQRLAQGDITVLDDLQKAMAKDYITNIVINDEEAQATMDSILTQIMEMDLENIEIGASIEDAPFYDALNMMLTQGQLTADQVNDILSTIGYNPEIEMVTLPFNAAEYTAASNGYTYEYTDPITQKSQTIHVTNDQYNQATSGATVQVPRINASKTVFKGSSGGGGVQKPSGSNKGGGGGGKDSAPKHAEKKNDLDKERYHTIQNQLEDLQSEYDAISEAKDRAFGEDKLNNIDKEIQKTNELIDKQKEYIDAISADLPVDKAVMDAYYKNLIGGTIQYDERGNISNYDQIQDAMFAKYNQMADRYDEDSEEWQIFEKKYEQLEKYIEQYEETYDLLRDEEETYQELLRQRMDLQLEKIQYAIELKLNIAEDGLAVLEYQMSKIEDNAFKAAEAIGLFSKKAELLYEQMVADREGLNDILGQQLSQAEIIQFYNGDMSVLEGKTFTEDQIDAIKEYRDNLLELNEEFDDIRKNIEEQVMEVFDAWNEKLEQGIDKLDHYGNVLESYKNIIDIVGKDTLGLSDTFMATLNQSSIDNAINKVTATKKSYETMIKAQNQAEQALEDAKARNDEASIKMWEENLQSITEEAQSAREEMLSAWEDALNGIAEQFEATVERLIENFNDSIYKLGGLEGLSEDFSRKKETQDLYVSDYQKIYELSKLTRDINNKIDDTDNIAGKQKLKKLLEQINELQKDGVEMSQYDLEYLQAEYDLRLAELELEEARNAKNTVRLQRDNEGNWSYIYTQNTDAVDQAQQKYEDALYAMQDLSTQYIDEMSEKLISTSQEMQEAIAAVRIQDFESQDAYYKEIDRIYRLYQDQLGQQESELNKAVANNKVLYDTDWTNYHNATGYKISDTENFVTTFKDSLLGTLLGSDQLTSNFSSIIGETAGQLIENLMSAANDYYTNLNTAMEAAGTSTGTFSDVLAEDVLSIQTNSEIASEAVKSMAEQMDTSIGNIMTSVEKWQIDYGNQIDLILNKNLQLINSFNDMIKVLSGGDMSGIDISYNISRTQVQEPETIASGDTGMYTGNWGTKDGKLAILHEKELVLNANDTENMLNMLELTKYLTSVIDINAKQLSQGIGLLQPATIKEDNREILEQQVHIQAEFPNVNDHNEIEEAFNSLINTASQYAYRK